MRHNNMNGFTLTEVLIAIVISFLLVAAATGTYISQNRSYVAQESVSEVNVQTQIAHDLVSGTIRSAGFGVDPNDLPGNPIGANAYTTVITPLDSAAGSDAVTIVIGRLIGQLWPPGVGPGTMACAPSPPLTTVPNALVYGIQYAGTVVPNNTDRSNLSIDGIEAASVVGVGVGTVTLSQQLSNNYPLLDTDTDTFCDTGRPVYLVEDVTFCLDGNNTLRRIRRDAVLPACTGLPNSDDEAIADNVEDFQLAYAVDADGNGQIDDLNGNGMLDDGDFVDGGAVVDNATIRSVRVNILALTDKADINYQGLGSPPAQIENNPLVQAPDDFKRRWLQKIVKIRNL